MGSDLTMCWNGWFHMFLLISFSSLMICTNVALPNPPSSLQFSDVTATSVRITWNYNFNPGDISNYLIQYKPKNDDIYASFYSKLTATKFYIITGLMPSTEYELYVMAVNKAGYGPPSEPAYVTTEETTGEAIDTSRNHTEPLYVTTGETTGETVDTSRNHTEPLYVITGETTGETGGTGDTSSSPSVNQLIDNISADMPLIVYARPVASSRILLYWDNPTITNGVIFGYVVYYTKDAKLPLHLWKSQAVHGNRLTTVSGLKADTMYTLLVGILGLLGIQSLSDPVVVQTQLGISTQPLELKTSNITTTGFQLSWAPPNYKGEKIVAYDIKYKRQIEQGFYMMTEFDFQQPTTKYEHQFDYLKPNSTYSVWVFPRTNKGVGPGSLLNVTTKSKIVSADVPTAPTVTIRAGSENVMDKPSVYLTLVAPDETHGKLQEYKITYSISEGLHPETTKYYDSNITEANIEDLLWGTEYEFRISASNDKGLGQETYAFYKTPAISPTGKPSNLTFRFLDSGTVVFNWLPPYIEHRNGHILHYDVQFGPYDPVHQNFLGYNQGYNTETTWAVFEGIDINRDYKFTVKAWNSMGSGPESYLYVTPLSDPFAAIPILNGMVTSESSIELWWDIIPYNGTLTGFQVFYTLDPNEVLDLWNKISVPVTDSAVLQNLERHANYTIAVVAMSNKGPGIVSEPLSLRVKPMDVVMHLNAHAVTTHSANITWGPPIRLNPTHYVISYSEEKEFMDYQRLFQAESKPMKKTVNKRTHNFFIEYLEPFTTYNINVTAISPTQEYTPPVKITFTTNIAAPPSMVSPAFYGVRGEQEIAVLLPSASEEYGPIAYYYIVVVPEDHVDTAPDYFSEDNLISNTESDKDGVPYIAAKFLYHYIPYSFTIGDQNIYEGFRNKPLQKYKRYKFFVRAIADTPETITLYTSSPYSSWISLDMSLASEGELPKTLDQLIPQTTPVVTTTTTSGFDDITQGQETTEEMVCDQFTCIPLKTWLKKFSDPTEYSNDLEATTSTIPETSSEEIIDSDETSAFTMPITTTTIIQGCNEPWQIVGSDCVLIEDSELLTWPEARDACKRLNGYLAEPTDFTLLIDFISNNYLFEMESGKYLLGASDIETEGVWRTATSGHLVPNHVWGSGEPNNYQEQDCMCLWNSENDGPIVSDTWCNQRYKYVCQKGAVVPP